MNRNKIFIALFTFLFLIVGSIDAQYGNTKKKKKKKKSPAKTERSKSDRTTSNRPTKEKSDIGERVWYGLNVQNIGFFNGSFSMGLSPHVGYKITNNLSAGAMLKFDYYYEKGFISQVQRYKYSTLDFGPTVFSRYKIGEQFFAQLEYERAIFQRPTDGAIIINPDNGRVETSRTGEDYLYIGAGYGGGYPFGTYISLHYNLLDDIRSTRIPFDYRFGFVLNF